MTDLFGAYKSQSTLGLQRINSDKYPDTNKDFESTLRRTVSFVDYISQYLQQMQKGVDEANKDPLTKIRDVVSNMGILLGGGELLYGVDLGDLQYYLPAFAAMLGFDSDQPFPLNLFSAAEHFLLGYIVPLDSWGFAVEDVIDGWAVAFGIPQDFIDSLHELIESFQAITSDIPDLLVSLGSIFDIFGVWGSTSVFADLWHAVTQLFGSFDIHALGNLTDPIFHTLAPWIHQLANILDNLDAILKAFAGGINNLQGILNFASIFDAIDFMFPDFDGPYGIVQLVQNVFNTVSGAVTWTAGLIPALDASKITSGILNALRIPDITAAMSSGVQGIIDNIYQAIHGGITVGNTVASVKDALLHFPGVNLIGTVAASLITGLLSAINIPGLDASKIVSGQLAQSFINGLGTSLSNLQTDINSRLLSSIFGSRFKGGANLVSNPDLENTSIYWSSPAYGSISTDVAHTGTHSGKLIADGTANPTGYLTSDASTFQLISVAQAQVFYMEAWVYGKSTNVQTTGGANGVSLTTAMYDVSGTPISFVPAQQLTASTALNGFWTKLSGYIRVPANAVNMLCYVNLGSNVPAGEVYYFDNPVVRESTDANAINRALFLSDVPLTTILANLIPGIDASKIITGIFGTGRIPPLPASIISSGQFLASLIPPLDAAIISTGQFLAGLIPNLDASKIVTGLFDALRIPALDASKVITGVLNATLIPALDAAKIVTGTFARFLFGINDYENLAAGGSFDATNASNPWTMGSSWSISTAQSHSGTKSLTVNGAAAFSDCTLNPGQFEVKPQDQIYIEFWMYRDAAWNGTGSSTKLRCGNSVDNAFVGQVTYASTDAVAATWTKRSGTITVPTGVNNINFVLMQDDATAGNVWLDDIVIRRVKHTQLIPGLDVSKIISGVFGAAFIPSLDASKIVSGILNALQIPNITKAMSTDLTKAFGFLTTRTKVGPNLASNPDFENSNYLLTGGSTLAYSTAQKHSGTQSVLCTMTNGTFATPRLSVDDTAIINLPCAPNDVYYAEFWVYADAANVSNVAVWMQISTYDATGAALANTNTTTTLPTPGAWVKLSGYMVIPANAVAFAPYLVVNSTATTGDKYYFDDVKLYRVTETNQLTKALYNANTTLTNILSSVVPSLDASKIATGQFLASLIPNLNASIINAGTFLSSLIPNLNASIINAGTFLTGLIPALDASKITSGTFLTSLIPNITKAMSTDIQGLIDNVFQAINGGLTTGNTLASVKTALSNIPGANIVSALLAGVIPALDASKIATGQFLTSLIPNLNASIITAGTFLSSLIPNLNASIINAGTFLAGLIPSLDASKIATGQFLTSLIPNLNASIITAGTFLSSLIPNLNASIINAGTFLTSLIPALDASKITTGVMNALRIPDITSAMSSGVQSAQNALQSLYDNLYNGVKGIPLVGATIANVLSGFQDLMTKLFANTVPQSTITPIVVPLLSATKIDPTGGKIDQQNVPDVQAWMSTDTQTIIDAAHQVANGGNSTGNPASSFVDNLAKIIAAPGNPSTDTAVTVQSIGAGNQQNNTNSFVTASTNWTHTIGATANMLVVAVVWESGPISNVGGTAGFKRTVLCGTSAGTGTPMTSILTSKGTYSFTEIFILKSPPSGAKVITATMNAASNYLGGNICDGVAGNSIALTGVGKIGALDVESASGIAMVQTIAANTNAIVVQGFASEHPSAATGATITSYNKTSDYYSGNYVQGIKNVGGVNLPVGGAFLMGHSAGAASVSFSANETAAGDNYYGIAVAFFPSDPAPIGSCLRVFRASTSSSTALAAQTPTKLAANFFDTSTGAGAYATPDLAWDPTNNRVTVANAGSYAITLTLSVPNVTASSYFSCVLSKNGVWVRQGTTVYVPANASVSSTISTTFQIYLNANDYVELGGQRSISTSGSPVFIGDAAGTLSALEVALTNRSLN